jgi:hypothetical protein
MWRRNSAFGKCSVFIRCIFCLGVFCFILKYSLPGYSEDHIAHFTAFTINTIYLSMTNAEFGFGVK